MPTIRVFEPPLCCATGVCGPDVDQALVEFTANLASLKRAGADIERFNLATDPSAFASDPVAVAFLATAGAEALPLVHVDGVTVLTGRYPTRGELDRYAGAPVAALPMAGGGGCCGGSGCC